MSNTVPLGESVKLYKATDALFISTDQGEYAVLLDTSKIGAGFEYWAVIGGARLLGKTTPYDWTFDASNGIFDVETVGSYNIGNIRFNASTGFSELNPTETDYADLALLDKAFGPAFTSFDTTVSAGSTSQLISKSEIISTGPYIAYTYDSQEYAALNKYVYSGHNYYKLPFEMPDTFFYFRYYDEDVALSAGLYYGTYHPVPDGLHAIADIGVNVFYTAKNFESLPDGVYIREPVTTSSVKGTFVLSSPAPAKTPVKIIATNSDTPQVGGIADWHADRGETVDMRFALVYDDGSQEDITDLTTNYKFTFPDTYLATNGTYDISGSYVKVKVSAMASAELLLCGLQYAPGGEVDTSVDGVAPRVRVDNHIYPTNVEAYPATYTAKLGESFTPKYRLEYHEGIPSSTPAQYIDVTDFDYSNFLEFQGLSPQNPLTLEGNTFTVGSKFEASKIKGWGVWQNEGGYYRYADSGSRWSWSESSRFAYWYLRVPNYTPQYPTTSGNSQGGGGTHGAGETSTDISSELVHGSTVAAASNTAMYTRYLCTPAKINKVGDYLWNSNVLNNLVKGVVSLLYNSPNEALISLMQFPFDLSGMSGLQTENKAMYFGGKSVTEIDPDEGTPLATVIQAPALKSSACFIDWGTIHLSEYWGNFLDYSPHTKIDLYLPWGTGFVSIDPYQCLPGTLQVITNIDLNKGSCVHNVIGNNGCVIASHAGQPGMQLPLTSIDYSAKAAGLVTAAAAGIMSFGTFSAPVAGAGAVMSAERALSTTVETAVPSTWQNAAWDAPQVQQGATWAPCAHPGKLASSSLAIMRNPAHITRNGGFTDGSAAMGVQFPYIILSRPTESVPKDYASHYGFPSNIYCTLSTLTGYTEVGEIHLNGIPCLAEELTEIERLLKGGVIL